MKFEEEYFEHNEVKVRYLKGGRGQTILFLHGAGVSAIAYQTALRLLVKKYQVIAPDLPCFGKSSCPEPVWDFVDYANFLNNFTKSLRLSRFIIIGHSFGGGVAINLAAKNKKVSELILIDPTGIPLDCRPAILYLRFVIKNIKDLFLFRNILVFFIVLRNFLRNLATNSLRFLTVIKTINKSMYKEYTNFNNIEAKTLILWSDKNELFPRSYAEKFHRKIKKSRLIYIEGNHDGLLTNPEKIFDIIEKFCKNG